MKAIKEIAESKNFYRNISIILAVICIFQITSCAKNENKTENLIVQVEEMREKTEEYKNEINDKDYQIYQNEIKLKNTTEKLERMQALYMEASAELGEIKQKKTIPVYYCNHSGSDIVSKVCALLYFDPFRSENYCEHGWLVSGSQISLQEAWIDCLDDLVGYTNIEFEEYIWDTWTDEKIDEYYEEQDRNGENIYDAMIANIDSGMEIGEAFKKAVKDTNYGEISVVK